jgi:hypothetical protein
VTLALAQQPKKPGVPPKKPPKVDSGSEDNPYGGDVSKDGGAAAAMLDASAAPTGSGAGPVPAPLGLQANSGDGGIRPSPLNPTPEEMPTGKMDGGAPVDYDKLIADIAALRARVSAVGDSMFRSRVVVSIETDNDHAKIGRLTVSLDDGVVFTAPQNFRADDLKQVYAAGVAAGRHAITVDVDRTDERSDAFKTSQRTRFLVDVPRDQELAVDLKITDDSNMGKNFPGDQKGRYQLEVRMDAKARAPKK